MLQIDWEESAIANRVSVRPRVDEDLDNLKHIYNGIDSVLVGFPYVISLRLRFFRVSRRVF